METAVIHGATMCFITDSEMLLVAQLSQSLWRSVAGAGGCRQAEEKILQQPKSSCSIFSINIQIYIIYNIVQSDLDFQKYNSGFT